MSITGVHIHVCPVHTPTVLRTDLLSQPEERKKKKSLLKRQAGKIKTKTSLLFFLSLGPADTADIADITVHAILQY